MTGRPPAGVCGVILAAGRSTRAGEVDKLLEPVDGEPMVRRVARVALEAGLDPVLAVTPSPPGAVGAVLDGLPVVLVPNPESGSGMSTSLRQAVEALPDGADAAVILLGDMPWVEAGTVRALVQAFESSEGRGPCVPVHAGRRGNPVLWPARFFGDLAGLTGDVGARPLLDALSERVVSVELRDPGVLRDVDTLAEIASLRVHLPSTSRS